MDALQSNWLSLSEALKRNDPVLAPFIELTGPPSLRFERNHFKALCESVLSQQLAPKAAGAIIERFRALCPPFPKPEWVRKTRLPTLRKIGVSGQKAAYLRALATHWSDPAWRRGWNRLENEALIERLVQVHGVGVWTAHMFLIFALGRPDVLPVGDYGVRRGVGLLLKLPELPSPKAMPGLVSHWKGMESVASWYLWRALDQKWLK